MADTVACGSAEAAAIGDTFLTDRRLVVNHSHYVLAKQREIYNNRLSGTLSQFLLLCEGYVRHLS
ncbi:hypothetical protein CPB83DRAFT_419764 [Crepidotus variabilis]|uniref:Uncharacterized protein n=1 Tax=Crepidotus variabilis TaxID=179855 RepID=A0A9P6EQ68_9AGAR|nr:hypothetical protein CPB83DRAFT_419764 [Crepidotus variabilis]